MTYTHIIVIEYPVYSIPIPETWDMCSIFHSHSRDLGYVKPSDLNSQCVHGEPQQAKTVKYFTQCYYEGFVRVHVLGYLGLTNTSFLPPPSLWGSCAPTWNDSTYRHEVMQVGREVRGCHDNHLTICHLCFPSLSKTLLLPHVHIYTCTCTPTNTHTHSLSLPLSLSLSTKVLNDYAVMSTTHRDIVFYSN